VDLSLQPSDSVFVVFRQPENGAPSPVSTEKDPLLPSGLLGPVVIRSAAVIKLEPNN